MKIAASTYRCDRCDVVKSAKRLPMGWRRRMDDHICVECWKLEAPEDSYVLCYAISSSPATLQIPDGFWIQQRARRALWDGLVHIGERTLETVQELRKQYAPAEAATFEAASEAAKQAWEAVREAEAEEKAALVEIAKKVSKTSGDAFLALKKAAKAAGCDEKPLWVERDSEIAASAQWTYTTVETEEGRLSVKRVEGDNGWRLLRSNADDVIESYKRAWSQWIKQPGRGRPREHGQAMGDRLRTVLRYTNGQTTEALERGTPSVKLTTIHPDRKKGRIARLQLSCGAGTKFFEGNVHLHRPIPTEDGAIRQIAVIGDRFGDKWNWSLQVTVRTSRRFRPVPDARAEALAVDLRWRQCEDNKNEILVAQYLDTNDGGGQVRLDLAHRDRKNHRAGLPGSWQDMVVLQHQIDERIESLKAAVWKRCYGDSPFTPEWQKTRAQGLLRAVKKEEFKPAIDLLTEWEHEYRRLWRRLNRLHLQLVARRDQLYYEQAHKLCAQAEVIVLEGERESRQAMNLSRLAQLEGWGHMQRQTLAPGRFRDILLQIAPQYRTQIEVVEKHHTSTTCPTCGEILESSADLRRTCSKGHTWEQPQGACVELLCRWRERSGNDTGSKAARNSQTAEISMEI